MHKPIHRELIEQLASLSLALSDKLERISSESLEFTAAETTTDSTTDKVNPTHSASALCAAAVDSTLSGKPALTTHNTCEPTETNHDGATVDKLVEHMLPELEQSLRQQLKFLDSEAIAALYDDQT